MALDEIAHRVHRHQHHHDGDDDGGHHDPHLIDHADRRDDGVQREDDVHQHDLDDDGRERPAAARGRGRVGTGLDLVVDLPRRLEDEEEATRDEDEVAPGQPPDDKERPREAHDPRDREQEGQPGSERQGQAQAPRPRLLGRRQAAAEDRDEDDVVDAEDQLHRGQGDQREEILDAQAWSFLSWAAIGTKSYEGKTW